MGAVATAGIGSPAALRHALLAAGRRDLARRADAVHRACNAAAHPEIGEGLIADVLAAMGAVAPQSDEASSEESGGMGSRSSRTAAVAEAECFFIGDSAEEHETAARESEAGMEGSEQRVGGTGGMGGVGGVGGEGSIAMAVPTACIVAVPVTDETTIGEIRQRLQAAVVNGCAARMEEGHNDIYDATGERLGFDKTLVGNIFTEPCP